MRLIRALLGLDRNPQRLRAGGCDYEICEPTFEVQIAMAKPLSRIAATMEILGPDASIVDVLARNGNDLIEVVSAALQADPQVVRGFTPHEFDRAYSVVLQSKHGPFIRRALVDAALRQSPMTTGADGVSLSRD